MRILKKSLLELAVSLPNGFGKKGICLLIWFFTPMHGELFAQKFSESDPLHLVYTIKDGLNSNFIVDLFNDSRGLLWIGTQNGLNTFDGKHFQSVSFDQVRQSFVTNICESPQGEIWFCTLGGGIYYVDEGKAVAHKANHHIFQLRDYQIIPTALTVDSLGTVYMSYSQGILKTQADSFQQIAVKVVDGKGVFQTVNDRLMGFFNHRAGELQSTQINFFDWTSTFPEENTGGKGRAISYFSNTRNSFAISNGVETKLMVENTLYKIYTHKTVSNSIYFENDSTFWLGTLGGGAYQYINDRLVKRCFEGAKIHAVLRDFEGGYWFGTEYGLIYVQHMNVIELKISGIENSYPIQIINQNGTLGVLNDRFQLLYNGEVGEPCLKKENVHSYKTLHSTTSSFFSYYSTFEHIRYLAELDWQNRSMINSMVVEGHTRYIYTNDEDTFRFSSECMFLGMTEEVYLDPKYSLRRVEEVNPTARKGVYSANHSKGITYFRVDKKREIRPLHIIPTESASKFKISVGGIDLIATEDDRFYVIDTVLKQVRPASNLGRCDISYSYRLDSTVTLLGTENGLSMISGNKPKSVEDLVLRDISSELGLPKSLVEDIVVIDSAVLFIQDKKLVSLPISLIQQDDMSKGKLSLDKVLVNNDPWSRNQRIYNDAHISIELLACSFKGRMDYNAQFRLLPLQDKWSTSYSKKLDFYQLPSNDYTLQIRDSYGKLVEMDFTVVKYYYQTLSFQGLVYVFVLGLMIVPIYLMQRNKAIKMRLEAEKSSWRLKTLTSRLQPHFLFNALSSIQSYMLNNQPRESSNFLAKFSMHIRHSLEQSTNDEIVLGKALELLENYLALEKMRLYNSFEYSLTVDPGIDIYAIKVPVMLMQPYVENAVIHGVADIDYEGKIDIRISKKGSRSILCRIVDNGKGIGAEASNSKGNGLGTSINRERIALLRGLQKQHISVDFAPNQGQSGLCVNIVIELLR